LKEYGYDTEIIDSLANMVVINKQANRRISSSVPEKYIKDLRISKEMLESQFVPIDENSSLYKVTSYEEFLKRRANILSSEMKKLC
jgi:hypothetical protein